MVIFFSAFLYYVIIKISGGKNIEHKKSQIVNYPAQEFLVRSDSFTCCLHIVFSDSNISTCSELTKRKRKNS